MEVGVGADGREERGRVKMRRNTAVMAGGGDGGVHLLSPPPTPQVSRAAREATGGEKHDE